MVNAGREGKRKGMAGSAQPNYPNRYEPIDNVRKLQRKLWVAAKQHPERRFHALYDRIYRDDILWQAWQRVLRNKGAAGVDRLSLPEVKEYGVERMLSELQNDLKTGSYRPAPTLHHQIPKPQGGVRPLSIPTVRDRVAQTAAKMVLEPVFEPDFSPVSYGFRPRRSATDAMEVIRKQFINGYDHVLEADIEDFFGTIDHDKLMAMVAQRVSDRRVLKLIRLWLKAGVLEEGKYRTTVAGTPQGGVISPLLSNIYLNNLDHPLNKQNHAVLVRYADDFVVLCKDEGGVKEAKLKVQKVLNELGLKLNPDKTKAVKLKDGKEGFDFLGCHFRARISGRLLERGIKRYYLHRWPSKRSMKQIRRKVKDQTGKNRTGVGDIRIVIRDLNPILRGWGNYFRTGNAANKFVEVDRYVWWRLMRLLVKRHGRNLKAGQVDKWTSDWMKDLGLHRLRGTISYPGVA